MKGPNPTSIFRVILRMAYREIEWDEKYYLGGGGSDYGQGDGALLCYLRSFWMAPGVSILFASSVDLSKPRRADKISNTPLQSPWGNSKELTVSSATAIAPPNDPFVGYEFRLQSNTGWFQNHLLSGVSDDWVLNTAPTLDAGFISPTLAGTTLTLPTLATPVSTLLTSGAGLIAFQLFLLKRTAYVYQAVVPPLTGKVFVQSSESPPWAKIQFRKISKRRHSGSFRKGKGRFVA